MKMDPIVREYQRKMILYCIGCGTVLFAIPIFADYFQLHDDLSGWMRYLWQLKYGVLENFQA